MSDSTPLRVTATKRFDRSYQRYVGRDRVRRNNVDAALRRLAADMDDPRLRTHALTGDLGSTYACSCGYDCPIVFKIQANPSHKIREVLLIEVGTHDEVY